MRLRSYFFSVSAGYALLLVNIAYTLLSIPLALHYLGQTQFGLWALTMQITIVLNLADGGLSGALTRILIDHKDDKTSPAYRQTLYTVWFALLAVAAAIACFAMASSGWIIGLLEIPAAHLSFYPAFLTAYLLYFAFAFAFKPVILVLIAHQKEYLFSISSIIALVLSFIVLWICLQTGMGLWSLLVAQAAGFIVSLGINFFQGKRHGYLPSFSPADCLQTDKLREVMYFGWQRVVASFGHTVLLTAPTFLITRFLGLDATATWTVGTRAMQLAAQVTCKLSDVSQPILAEMFVRGEFTALRKRFASIMIATLGVGALFAGLITASNHDFIRLWTRGVLSWDSSLDAVIAALLLLNVAQRLFWIPIGISKDLGLARYMTLFEAGIFLLVLLLWPRDSLSLMVIAAALAAAAVSISLPVYFMRSAKLLRSSPKSTFTVLAKPIAAVAVPLIFLGWLLSDQMETSTWLALFGKSILVGIAGMLCLSAMPDVRKLSIEMYLRYKQRKNSLSANSEPTVPSQL